MPPENETEQDHEAVVEAFFEELDAQEEAAEAPETPETPVEDESPSEEPETAEETPEAVEDEPEDEDSDEESEEEAEEEEELHPAEARRREQQAFYDQKVAALEQRLSSLDQWAQNVYQQQLLQHQQALQAQQTAAPANPLANVTREQVVQGVEQDLVGTFQAVAQHRPDLVATTIATAREKYGNEIGDQMQLDYSQYLATQEREAREAQYAQQMQVQQKAEEPARIEAVMSGMIDGIAKQYGESFAEIQDDFIKRAQETSGSFREYMDNHGLEMTPDAINYFLNKCVQDVREERITKQVAKPRKARKIAPAEHAESSTNSDGNREEDMTADELAINELLAGAKELSIDIAAPNR